MIRAILIASLSAIASLPVTLRAIAQTTYEPPCPSGNCGPTGTVGGTAPGQNEQTSSNTDRGSGRLDFLSWFGRDLGMDLHRTKLLNSLVLF